MRKHMALLARIQCSFSIPHLPPSLPPSPQASSFCCYTWAAHKYLPWSSVSSQRAGLMAVCAAHPEPDKASPSGAPGHDSGNRGSTQSPVKAARRGRIYRHHFINEQEKKSCAVPQMNGGGVSVFSCNGGGKGVLLVGLRLVPRQIDHISFNSWLNRHIFTNHWAQSMNKEQRHQPWGQAKKALTLLVDPDRVFTVILGKSSQLIKT